MICEICKKQMRYKEEKKLWWCSGWPDLEHKVVFVREEKQSSPITVIPEKPKTEEEIIIDELKAITLSPRIHKTGEEIRHEEIMKALREIYKVLTHIRDKGEFVD